MSRPEDPPGKPGRRSFNEAAHKLGYREDDVPAGPRAKPPSRSDGSSARPEAFGRPGARPSGRAGALVPAEPAGDEESGPPTAAPASEPDVVANAARLVLALGALGVVYGDIGTSPLYTMQVIFTTHGFAARATPLGVYGIVSLVFWSLMIVVSIKYAGVIMRAHNRGDGGIMALTALVSRRKLPRAFLLATLGIFGASLFFGDGMITPAISVLSAVEGLKVSAPGLAHLVVPIALVILVGLFVLQSRGTGTVGKLFGPVMLLWFSVIGVLGLSEVLRYPGVLQGLSPTWGARFMIHHGVAAFLTLGGVVLCVTGAEALYADRGHFGPKPIRLAWFTIVFPGVLLSYLGQGALILHKPSTVKNPFFLIVPHWGQFGMVVLAALATIIASQAVISGSFSVARQAIQLGFLPRLKIVHTSRMEGQIYAPAVNWMLCIGVVLLVFAFRNSNRLANAYGVAVTGTFILNTVLFLVVARTMWRTPRWRLVPLAALFLIVEISFFLANLAKLLHGAWLPLAVGAALSMVMMTWRRGREIVTAKRSEKEGPLDEFLDGLRDVEPQIRRVPGTAIFLSPGQVTTPLALRAEIEHTHALHETVLIVSVDDVSFPYVDDEDRYTIKWLGPEEFKLRYVRIRVGYQEVPNVPELLRLARRELLLERHLDLEDASYFLSRITLAADDDKQMAAWRKKLFVAVARNSTSPIEHFGLPIDRTVSMGSQITV